MSDKEKIKAAVSKLRKRDPRVIAIRNMIALAKAKGTPGDTGKDGLDGIRGADGINGKDGIDGMRGADGMHGAKGLDGSKGEMGAVGPQGDKGEAGMIWRGTYRSDLEYDIGDVVGVSGSAYVCVAATNQAPPVGFGWELLVSRGAQGIRGIKGEDGVGGGGAAAAGKLTGTTLAANVISSSLESVGTLEFLTVTNPIAGSITGNAATATLATSASNALTANTATTATSATTAGTVTTAAQPAITSVGTLANLTVTNTITGSVNGNAATATSATTAGTVTTAAQTAITSVGTLTALTVNGTLTLGTTALISSPSATALALKTVVPAGTGVTPTVQIICPSAAYTLTNGTGAQAVFNTGMRTITLQASTTYMFEGQYMITTGTAISHTTTMSFVLTSATMTNCTWATVSGAPAALNAGTSGAFTSIFNSVAGGIIATSSLVANKVITFKGIMRVNAGGTLVPNIQFSAAPGATCSTLIGSYIKFYPIGANTIDSVGTAIS